MKRRYFMIGAGTLALNSLVTGCNDNSATLRVRLLKNSIPVQLLNEFSKKLKQQAKLDFAPEAQLQDIFANLVSWKEPNKNSSDWGLSLPFSQPKVPVIADLVTLGDYWLAEAIRQKLIQPLDIKQLSQWSQLPRRWQELVRRNDQGQLDSGGKIWAAPYRWGSTVIAYRRDKFESQGLKPPTDWSDLWRPELRDRISLLNQPREVIGLTLKKLGYSYNTEPSKVPNLKDELQKLHQQVKLYSSGSYLQPLALGDTWLAVAWSTDVLLAQKREPDIAAVVPKSGTAIWTDLWVRPANVTANSVETRDLASLAYEWINFCWQPQTASQISLFSRATSPAIANLNPAEIPQDIRNNRVLLPESQVLENSDFLYPLSKSTAEQYRSLWQEIRNV